MKGDKLGRQGDSGSQEPTSLGDKAAAVYRPNRDFGNQ